MDINCNAGFGDPLGVETLAWIKREEFHAVRQDAKSALRSKPLIEEIVGAGLKAILLLGEDIWFDPNAAYCVAEDAVDSGLDPVAVEVGNELDDPAKKMNGRRFTPQEYAIAFTNVFNSVRLVAPQAHVLTAGIRSTTRESIRWLAQVTAAGIPEAAEIGYHSYRPGSPNRANDGYSSRAAEFDDLKSATRNRPIWNTEVGWHTARRSICKGPLSDDEVARRLWDEALLNAQAGARCMTIYQLNDGPTLDWRDRFGIRRKDGSPKPQASIAARWAREGR